MKSNSAGQRTRLKRDALFFDTLYIITLSSYKDAISNMQI